MSLTALETVDHAAWNAIVKRYVYEQGRVDYAGLKQHDAAALNGYLASLASTDVAHLPRDEQLAFWINAYNACVFKGVLDHYPLKSVQDIDGFFDAIRYPVGGASLTLNEIEAKGRALGDWRIHFGVVCASSSCPFIRNEAYMAGRLNAQLTDQAKRFLADPSRGLRMEGRTLWVSKIFKWYAKDFVPKGALTAHTLVLLLTPYIGTDVAQAVQQGKLDLKFLDYDWLLNFMPKFHDS